VIEADAAAVDDLRARNEMFDSVIKALRAVGDHRRAVGILGELTGVSRRRHRPGAGPHDPYWAIVTEAQR
jgi:hypothetical protein